MSIETHEPGALPRPLRLERRCPRDHGDLVYDALGNVYACETCEYSQEGLLPKPKDLVVVPGNGVSRDEMIPLAKLAREIGISQAGAQDRAERLSIQYRRSGRQEVTRDEAQRIRDFKQIRSMTSRAPDHPWNGRHPTPELPEPTPIGSQPAPIALLDRVETPAAAPIEPDRSAHDVSNPTDVEKGLLERIGALERQIAESEQASRERIADLKALLASSEKAVGYLDERMTRLRADLIEISAYEIPSKKALRGAYIIQAIARAALETDELEDVDE